MRRLAMACALFALAGCYNVSYTTNLTGSGQYKEDRGDFFFWGLAGEKVIDMKVACPQGVARWRSQQTFVDGLLGLVTLGIYIPRHVQLECASGKAWNLTFDGAGRLVAAAEATPDAG